MKIQILVLDTLAHMVSLYPSLCRPLQTALSNVALSHLNGSAPNPTPVAMVEASSRLYSVLPLTGGKVGAAALWRKSLDDTVAFAWGAFLQLRTTYPNQGMFVNISISQRVRCSKSSSSPCCLRQARFFDGGSSHRRAIGTRPPQGRCTYHWRPLTVRRFERVCAVKTQC